MRVLSLKLGMLTSSGLPQRGGRRLRQAGIQAGAKRETVNKSRRKRPDETTCSILKWTGGFVFALWGGHTVRKGNGGASDSIQLRVFPGGEAETETPFWREQRESCNGMSLDVQALDGRRVTVSAHLTERK